MSILITGAAGYIGSHAVQRLLRDGHRVVGLDNLFRGHRAAIERLHSGPGGDRLTFIPGDVGDAPLLARLMVEHRIDTVLHFAALAYVGESVDLPMRYYRANTAGTLGLVEAIEAAAHGGQVVERLVFSSTCASYGEPSPDMVPIPEHCPQRPVNPYGWSKLFCERMLLDHAAAANKRGRPIGLAMLRYFNVAGCDRSGLLGEHHHPETHLIPAAIQSVLGTREHFGAAGGLTVFGTDYPTADGTCVRDYVHVEDLIDAHATVMSALTPGETRIYNLGIGRGYSVREILDSVARVAKRPVPAVEGPRRPGDPPTLFANPKKIQQELGWRAAVTDLDEIVASAWDWMSRHPRGYGQSAHIP